MENPIKKVSVVLEGEGVQGIILEVSHLPREFIIHIGFARYRAEFVRSRELSNGDRIDVLEHYVLTPSPLCTVI